MESRDGDDVIAQLERCCYRDNDLNAAVAQCEQALEAALHGPQGARVLAATATVCAKLGLLQLCLHCADTVIALDPLWAVGYSRRGAVLAAMGLHEQALSMFEFAREAMELHRSSLPITGRDRKVIEKGFDACVQVCTHVTTAENQNGDATISIEELGRYPSTPHLHFSPQVHADDEVSRFDVDIFCNKEVVVTEKLDGGNCCLFAGKVFARTHKHETTHDSFGPVKTRYMEARNSQQLVFAELDRLGVRMFGENMFGIHSIDYNEISHAFYVFAMHGTSHLSELAAASSPKTNAQFVGFMGRVKQALQSIEGVADTEADESNHLEGPIWFDWFSTVGLSACVDLPVVPAIWVGTATSGNCLQHMMEEAAHLSSCVRARVMEDGCPVTPEGFVVRHTCAFPNSNFDAHIGKFVRAGHNQTSPDWMRTWKRATISGSSSRRQRLEELADLLTSPQDTKMYSTDPWHWFVTNSRVRAAVRTFVARLATQYDHTKSAPNMWTHSLRCADEAEGTAATETHEDGKVRKFPRTAHLFHSRGATSDDIVLSSGEVERFLKREVIVQEKVDGANLGFSLTSDYQLRIQNRSHFVNEQTSEQFQRLGVWLEAHKFELYDILRPGRDILFGEWLFARHSKHYTRLPDYFLAFDLFDTHTNTFATVAQLTERLNSTTIQMVPTLGSFHFEHVDEIRALLERQSAFSDDFVEGVVLRIESEQRVLHRAKAVRNDFQQGIEEGGHWIQRKLEKNQVVV